MPEEGVSFFEIQTLPGKLNPHEPLEPANFETPLNFTDPKFPTPIT